MLKLFAAALSLFPLAAILQAQSTNASLTGRVTDPSEAVVPNVRVAAISAGTNLHYEVLTDASGEYHLANLAPGAYRIEIEKPGFKKLVKPDVVRGSLDLWTHPRTARP